MQKTILITGGAGFIGSHTCVMLTQMGYTSIILDNLSNSHKNVIDRLEKITGIRPEFIQGDVRNQALLNEIFNTYSIEAVVHFAALKSVQESVAMPLAYYDNNVTGTLHLLEAMHHAKVKTIIFSSSATVYGNIDTIPYQEHHSRAPINPYGRCKMIVEDILADLHRADPSWRIACLRYFNPVGAHKSGYLGEAPQGTPNNLMPFLTQVALGRYSKLRIFGNDYSTADGTCIRDYVHVMDVAAGHIAALNLLIQKPEFLTINLGSGKGTSVLEMLRAFEEATGCTIPYEFANRREGDLPAYWADVNQAERILGWKPKLTTYEMCEDTWRWHQNNPSINSNPKL